MPSTDDLWSMYGHQILKFAAPDFDPTKQQFSMASSTLSLDLGNPDPAVVNGYIYNLGNTIPAPSPCYAPGSGLFTAYQRFLDAIDLHGDTNPNLDSQINIAAAMPPRPISRMCRARPSRHGRPTRPWCPALASRTM